jgi:hypothetical protein
VEVKLMKEMLTSMLIPVILSTMVGMAARVSTEPKNPPPPNEPSKILGQVETIRGTLMATISDQRLIVIKTADGVSYNFKVPPAAEIEIGEKKGVFEDLAVLVNTNISVTFVPMQNGNVARKIVVP